MLNAWHWIKARAGEPSTHAAIAAALAAAGPYAGDWKGACVVGAAFFCALGVAVPETAEEVHEEALT